MTVTVPTAGTPGLATWAAAIANFHNARAAITAATGNISTTQTQVVGLTIPADVLEAGATFRVTAYGTASNSSGAARTLTLRCRVGATTLTGNIAVERGPNIADGAAAEGFMASFDVTFRAVGASGTCIGAGVTIGGPSMPLNTNAFVTTETATVAADTTGALILELTAVTGHADATVNFRVASIERVA